MFTFIYGKALELATWFPLWELFGALNFLYHIFLILFHRLFFMKLIAIALWVTAHLFVIFNLQSNRWKFLYYIAAEYLDYFSNLLLNLKSQMKKINNCKKCTKYCWRVVNATPSPTVQRTTQATRKQENARQV